MTPIVDPTVGRLISAISARDPKAFAACYAPDAVLVEPLFPEPHTGRAEIAAGEQSLFDAFSEVEVELITVLADGPRRAVQLVMHATNSGPIRLDADTAIPATGRHIALPMAWFLELNGDGLITSERDYFDAAAFMRQLGLAE